MKLKKLRRKLLKDFQMALELDRYRYNEQGWHGSLAKLATKTDLVRLENKIMSAISTYALKQNSFFDRLDTAILGLTSDVSALNDKITQLQNTQGSVTPEDQALLDDLQARGEALAAKLEALDAITPPVTPNG